MRWVLAVIGLALLTWTVLSAVTQVEPGERAVVRRFGRILDYQPGPGLFVGLPWGMDRVDRVPVGRVRRVVVGMVDRGAEEDVTPAGQLLTGDNNLVNVQAEVYYRVIEDQVARYVVQADRADAVVARAAEAVLAEWIAGRGVEVVLRQGPSLLPPFLKARMRERLAPFDLGVQVEEASINRLLPPEEVKEAFERVTQAETNVRTQRNQALQEADKKQRAAEAEVFRIQRQTASYAQEQRFQASAEAEIYVKRLQEYRKLLARDPVYLNTLWQDEMTRLYARMREAGRIDVLDHYLSSEGLNLTQFPLLPKKK